MKLDLLSSATVIDRAVKFVDRKRGLIPQSKEVVAIEEDVSEELTQPR